MELHDVRISIPVGTSSPPEIVAVDGSHRFNGQEATLLWTMDLLDQSNKTGSLEFNIASRDPEAFFPITVTFASTQLFCDVQVRGVSCHVVGGCDGDVGRSRKTEPPVICRAEFVDISESDPLLLCSGTWQSRCVAAHGLTSLP